MKYIPGHLDFALALVMAMLMAIEVRVFAALGRAVERGVPRETRLPAYTYLIVYQWALVACTLALWIAKGRQWSMLLLGSPNRWGFVACLVLAGAFGGLATVQRRSLLNRPELAATARRQVAQIEMLSPRTLPERRWWTAVAITAGCCEEVLFRGFLLAFVAGFTGLGAAVLINVLLFGLFHAYYGWKGILRTGMFGLVMTLIALWSASLIPAIIIHAFVDLTGGDLAYRVLSRRIESPGQQTGIQA